MEMLGIILVVAVFIYAILHKVEKRYKEDRKIIVKPGSYVEIVNGEITRIR